MSNERLETWCDCIPTEICVCNHYGFDHDIKGCKKCKCKAKKGVRKSLE